jgi:hypothetical protein
MRLNKSKDGNLRATFQITFRVGLSELTNFLYYQFTNTDSFPKSRTAMLREMRTALHHYGSDYMGDCDHEDALCDELCELDASSDDQKAALDAYDTACIAHVRKLFPEFAGEADPLL